MLNTSYTVNVGSPAADITYGSKTQLDGQAVEYSAPSAQGDLIGRPTLLVSHVKTKQGVVRTLVSFRTPRFDTPSGTYKGFSKLDLVLNRTQDQPVAMLKVELEKLTDFLLTAGVSDEIVNASI